MRKFSHENVLQFVALSSASYPMVMITEFVRQTLLQYLRTKLHWKHISIQTIVAFAAQVKQINPKYFVHLTYETDTTNN